MSHGRRRVVILLGGVLALSSADQATIGAVASELESSLRITNTDVGLLASAVSLIAAVTTLPIGMLSDRVNRTRLLGGSIVLWSVAMVVSGASTSYAMLFLSRLALGAVLGTAGPTLSSLTGDFFEPSERARMWGVILTGELAGAGFGFVVSGETAAVLSWRFAFWLLAIPGLVLAWAILRHLPEPERRESRRVTTRQAFKHILRVRTNLVLILASALGYFFLSGIRTFAVVFVRAHYGVGQAAATGVLALLGVGAVAGVLAGGWIADRLVARGRVAGRLIVPAAGYALAALALAPGVASPVLLVSIPLFMLGAGALAGAEPPVDAARLDVMPPSLWGRAEAVRTLLRAVAEGSAPLAFGVVSDQLGGSSIHGAPTGPGGFDGSAAGGGTALSTTFLIMLVPVLLAGWVLFTGRRRYESDVAAARSVSRAGRRRG